MKRSRWAFVILAVLALGLMALLIFAELRNRARTILTASALGQCTGALKKVAQEDKPQTTQALHAFLQKQPIDWNGCSTTPDGIRDSWGNLVEASLAEERWSFRSAGRDGKMGTKDDLISE